jgi:hypothetical protein
MTDSAWDDKHIASRVIEQVSPGKFEARDRKASDAAPGVGTRWRHYKGGEYVVTGLVIHSETLVPLVTYRTAAGHPHDWARPLSMWHDEITSEHGREPRFRQLPHTVCQKFLDATGGRK